MEKAELIDLITKEVLEILNNNYSNFSERQNLLPDVLVVGDIDALPVLDRTKYNFYLAENLTDIDCLSSFEKVYVEKLTLTELSDIANGRDCGLTQKIVLGSLLLGKKVAILRSALPHRRYALTSDRQLYVMYEEYVRKLKAMRIEFIVGKYECNSYLSAAKPDPDIPDGIITESVARIMARDIVEDVIDIPKGTVITPSAIDIFNQTGKKMNFI